MFKTIFRKQFAAYMCTFALCFGVLGIGLISLSQSFFVNQKEKDLFKQCVNIEEVLKSSPAQLNNPYMFFGGSFFILEVNESDQIETKFSPFAVTYDLKEAHPNDIGEIIYNVLKTDTIKPLLEGEKITVKGTFGGLYKENVITVCYPVNITLRMVTGSEAGFQLETTEIFRYAIFISTPLTEIEQMARDFMRIMIVCLLISLLISFVFVYLSSRTISKPIHKMTEAAKTIADGNFDKRLTVKSRDEVGQLAESFNYMAEKLDNHETSRREFISNISHDLRSPMTSIKGFLQAIIDGTAPEETHGRYLNIVLDETDRLSKLANDILDINNINEADSGLSLEDFDICELIRRTVALIEPRAAEKQIEMNVSLAEETTVVCADREKIQRVIYNLCENAVKFTETNGKLTIETKVLNNGKIRISVSDSGIGISAEDQKRVFDRFYKVDLSRGGDKRGSGLGLSIVSEFVKMHGEKIEIRSEIGEGSEFSFVLPIGDRK